MYRELRVQRSHRELLKAIAERGFHPPSVTSILKNEPVHDHRFDPRMAQRGDIVRNITEAAIMGDKEGSARGMENLKRFDEETMVMQQGESGEGS